MKAQPGRSSGMEQVRREKIRDGEDERCRKSEEGDAGAREGREVAKLCVFECFVAPEGRTVGLLKLRVRSQLAR